MVFLILDDCVIHTFETPELAARAVEGIDIEDCLRAAFDDEGRRLSVDWIEKPVRGRFSISVGKYRFVPEPESDLAAFAAFLRDAEADGPLPVEARAAIERLRARSRSAL